MIDCEYEKDYIMAEADPREQEIAELIHICCKLEKQLASVRAERDEARREVCRLLAIDVPSPSTHERDPIAHAIIFGWDCFN